MVGLFGHLSKISTHEPIIIILIQSSILNSFQFMTIWRHVWVSLDSAGVQFRQFVT